ncbi:MAG: hypothetical protein AAF429_07260 [Pseudomonadota bacterium]
MLKTTYCLSYLGLAAAYGAPELGVEKDICQNAIIGFYLLLSFLALKSH